MGNFTSDIFKTLAENLDSASYYVAEDLTRRLGYTVYEQRASYLIARALISQCTIDVLCDVCKNIEDQDNEKFEKFVYEKLNEGGDV